jgi:hypothetical protein
MQNEESKNIARRARKRVPPVYDVFLDAKPQNEQFQPPSSLHLIVSLFSPITHKLTSKGLDSTLGGEFPYGGHHNFFFFLPRKMRLPQMVTIATLVAFALLGTATATGTATAFVLQDSDSKSRVSSRLHSFAQEGPPLSRRQLGELTVAAIGLGGTFLGTRESTPIDYGLWGILPVGTYRQKKTIRQTLAEDQIWTLDQKFGILNVQVPQRTVIVRLQEGGLFVYNPVVPLASVWIW